MCLYKNQNVHKIAEEDIVCYKIVVRDKKTGELCSYWHKVPIRLDEPIIAKLSEYVKRDLSRIDKPLVLRAEVVHTYRDCVLDSVYLNMIADDIKWWTTTLLHEVVMIECIIPKGTIYIENCPNKHKLHTPRDNDFAQYGALCVIPKRIIRVL